MKLLPVLLLAAIAVGCGYGSHSITPAAPGTVPTISALVPNNVIAGSSSFMLEVDGAQFGSQAVVNFNGAKMTTTFVSAGKLTASIPAGAIMNAGSVPVTVTNPGTAGGPYGGGTNSATSTAANFTIN